MKSHIQIINSVPKPYKRKIQVIFFYILFLVPFILFAKNEDIPKPSGKLVNDYVGILKPDEINTLERKLVAFNDSVSVQIAVIIVPDFKGYDKAEYATMIGTEWGVGQKGFDNGIVILINPVGKEGKREAYIAVGYGLEPVIPDAVAKRIFQNEMLPYFQKNQYYQGIDKAVNTLMSLAAKELTARQYMKKNQKSLWVALVPLLALILVFVLIKVTNKSVYSPGKNLSFWTALLLLTSMNRRNRGVWNNFSGGKGSGFGGGGFSGFGGGSFGGGGAGGSW